MKIVSIVGARPQFIKASVISREIATRKGIKEIIIHTGQHFDSNMSDIFFQEMHIPQPNYNLYINGGTHGKMTGLMLGKIEEVLINENPDVVIVYGDTNSTLAGALAAVKMHIPLAHVEGGLRSFNMLMPEEVNRIVTDRISNWIFCPTEVALDNLANEGYFLPERNIQNKTVVKNVGDIMYEAVLYYAQFASPSKIIAKIVEDLDQFYIATVHRAENLHNPDRLRNIFDALSCISQTVPIVFPMHPNTKKIVTELNIKQGNIISVDPVGYFDMLVLLSKCSAVLTDSGGLQKESFFFQKPCITLRDETEWTELVSGGFNMLTGADRDKIIRCENLIHGRTDKPFPLLYGNGKTARQIIDCIEQG